MKSKIQNKVLVIPPIFLLFVLMSCHSSRNVVSVKPTDKQVVTEVNYTNSQKELAKWLMSQPQEVRDEFKRDFTFSKKEINSFVDSLRKQ
jgi:hypothetical protein